MIEINDSSFCFISLVFFISPFLFLSCVFHPTIRFLTYCSLTFIIYEDNMLTHQALRKESICAKKIFLELTSTQVLLLVSFLAVNKNLTLVNYKKCIFRILQILLTAGFVINYYQIYSHSFIHSFIRSYLVASG